MSLTRLLGSALDAPQPGRVPLHYPTGRDCAGGIQVSGGFAVARTTVRGKRIPKAGGDSVPFETKYLDVLRRTAEGKWEFVYRMWNSNIK